MSTWRFEPDRQFNLDNVQKYLAEIKSLIDPNDIPVSFVNLENEFRVQDYKLRGLQASVINDTESTPEVYEKHLEKLIRDLDSESAKHLIQLMATHKFDLFCTNLYLEQLLKQNNLTEISEMLKLLANSKQKNRCTETTLDTFKTTLIKIINHNSDKYISLTNDVAKDILSVFKRYGIKDDVIFYKIATNLILNKEKNITEIIQSLEFSDDKIKQRLLNHARAAKLFCTGKSVFFDEISHNNIHVLEKEKKQDPFAQFYYASALYEVRHTSIGSDESKPSTTDIAENLELALKNGVEFATYALKEIGYKDSKILSLLINAAINDPSNYFISLELKKHAKHLASQEQSLIGLFPSESELREEFFVAYIQKNISNLSKIRRKNINLYETLKKDVLKLESEHNFEFSFSDSPDIVEK